jgi:amidophosphoribosyltransferase
MYGGGKVAPEIYDGLLALQHRGQDAAGIVTYDGQFHLRKGEGLVRDIFQDRHMSQLGGGWGIGHVRYPTAGSGGIEDAQPMLTPVPYGIAMAHNGNVTNYHALRRQIVDREKRFVNSCCDVEVLLHLFAGKLADLTRAKPFSPEAVFSAVAEVFGRAQGSYSVAGIIAGRGLFAFRDPFGIKPVVLGTRRVDGEEHFCVASESVVLDLLDFRGTQNLNAGEAVFIDADRRLHRSQVVPGDHHPCIFELVYFARPDSFLDKINVYKTRLRLGEALGKRWLADKAPSVDVVIPVPDSARPAAMSMAQVLGVPYREGLVKNRYIGRTFIMAGQENRRKSVRHKLNTIRIEFEGKDVLIVDDSIVRGNTSPTIVRMAREAGARKVYLASYSPPLRHPCVYGIDMATRGEFIAREGRSIEEIRQLLGIDYLFYQTYEDLVRSAQEGNPEVSKFCTACFSGHYPTGDVTADILEAWERDRTLAGTPL